MNPWWHRLDQLPFFSIIILDFFFQLEYILWIFFVLLIHFAEDFFRLHLEDVEKLIEFVQILFKRLDALLKLLFKFGVELLDPFILVYFGLRR